MPLAIQIHPGLPPILAPFFEEIVEAELDGRLSAAPERDPRLVDMRCPTQYAWAATGVALARPFARVVSLAMLRRRLSTVERALHTSGYVLGGHFGAYPGVDNPEVVFELDGASAAYAGSHLIPALRRSRVAALAWPVLQSFLGFSPAIGGVLTIGARR